MAMVLLADLLTSISFAAEYPRSLDLPDDPAVRAALERVSTRSGVALPRGSWPLMAREAREFLDQALAVDSAVLRPSDSLALRDLLKGPIELKRWEGAGSSLLALNARAGGQWTATDSGDGHNERMGWLGGRMYGALGGELWFSSEAHIFTRWSDDYLYWDRYALADGEPSTVPLNDPNVASRYKTNTGARYTAWAQWSRDWVALKYGRDRVQYGPGSWTGLTTNGSTPPYQMLDARVFPFPWLSVQATVLEARKGEVEGGIWFPGDERKWMHVHRFEVRPFRGLTAAFQNQVLYKDSGGVNPAYLLPLVPIFFAQDLSGNRDNAAMQFDLAYASPWGAKIWSALLLDDTNGPMDLFGSHWINRWALLVGGQYLSPWPRVDADLTAEVSLVRPWTYTGGREEAYTFAHYGLPMGSELGPDSRTIHVRLAWRPIRWMEAGFSSASLEKGEGRQAELGRVNGRDGFYAQNSKLLEGAKRKQTRFGLDLQSRWKSIAAIGVELEYAQEKRTGSAKTTWLEGRASWSADW